MLTLHLTVRADRAGPDRGRATGTDLQLRAQPGAVVAQALAPLARALGIDQVMGVAVAGVRLRGDHRIGDPPLLDGAELALLTRSSSPAPVLDLRVATGRLPVRSVALPAGRWVVGRGATAVLRINDPDVSRSHLELTALTHPAGGPTCTVRDLGSTNGTVLRTRSAGGPADLPVGPEPVPVPAGAELLIGGSTLSIQLRHDASGQCQSCHPRCGQIPSGTTASGRSARGPADPDGPVGPLPLAAVRAGGDGTVQVNRAPRVRGATAAAVIDYPDEPATPARAKPPWLALVLPLLVAVPVAILWHQPTFLILAAASPVLGLAQFVQDRRSRRGEQARAAATYRQECDRLDADLARSLTQDSADRHAQDPGPAHVHAVAAGPAEPLWQRTPADDDFLAVRVGLAPLPARVTVRRGRVDQPQIQHPAPLVVGLRTAGVVGLCGPQGARRAMAGWLVGQAAVWHSPRELRLVVLAAHDPGRWWGWTAWLPHAAPAAPGPGTTAEAHTLVVLDGAAELRRRPGVAALLGQAPGRGLTVLCLAGDRAELPVECTAVVAVGADAGVLELAGRAAQPFDPDLPTPSWLERLARHLSPLRDATPDPEVAVLPREVRLLDLVSAAPAEIAHHWLGEADHRGRLPALLGATAAGPLVVDLARDGPHALVAGTTGAGKSELLTTLVAGLAIEHPPHRLALLLVDYKGGTALQRLAALPHVTGVLTDLDAPAAQRALASLRAELRRRERWLGAEPVRRAADLPRLVIVVDEFRVLAEEQPDLLAGLVRVATVGRGLGVHLVLATQRPAGVVSPDIRANTNLRIALRLRDRSDSVDVLDLADAADLPSDRPGRGILRVGNGPPVAFQTAHLPAEPIEGGADQSVAVAVVDVDPAVPTRRLIRDSGAGAAAGTPRDGLDHLDDPNHPDDVAASAGANGPTEAGHEADLDHLVAAVRAAARLTGAPAAPAPWLEPLPRMIPWHRLRRVAGLDPDLDPGPGLPLGVADLPEQQARAVVRWDPQRDGHLAVIGAPGSGRTTVLRVLALAAEDAATGGLAGRDGRRRGIHVHAIDAGGGLIELAGRSVGTVVPADDLDRARRLLALLAQEVRDRQFHRRPDPTGTPPPVVVLLVDGWESVEEAWAAVDHGRSVEDLLRLARDGSGVGLRLAVTGGRALLGAAPGAVLTERLLLGAVDPMVALMAGVPADRLPRPMGATGPAGPTGSARASGAAPGRLLRVCPGAEPVEAQVAWPEPVPSEQDELIEQAEPADGAAAHRRFDPPPRLRPLPAWVGVDDLAAPSADPALAAVGIGGDDARVVGLPVSGARGALVCAGPAGGRSTALATLARSLARSGRPVLALTGGGAIALVGTDLLCSAGPPGAAPAHLASRARQALADLASVGEPVLLLDDGWAQLPGIEDLAVERFSSSTGLAVVACATPADALVAFRGLLPLLRATRTGLVLGARASTDGECLGVRLPPSAAGPPGRGVLVVAGRVEPVQVADAGTLDGAGSLDRTGTLLDGTGTPADAGTLSGRGEKLDPISGRCPIGSIGTDRGI